MAVDAELTMLHDTADERRAAAPESDDLTSLATRPVPAPRAGADDDGLGGYQR